LDAQIAVFQYNWFTLCHDFLILLDDGVFWYKYIPWSFDQSISFDLHQGFCPQFKTSELWEQTDWFNQWSKCYSLCNPCLSSIDLLVHLWVHPEFTFMYCEDHIWLTYPTKLLHIPTLEDGTVVKPIIVPLKGWKG